MCTFIALTMCWILHSPVTDNKQRLDQLVIAHKSAREALQILHGTIVQKTEEKASPLNLQGSFWKTNEGYRLRVSRPADSTFRDRTVDTLFFQGRFTQLVRRNRSFGEETILVKQDHKAVLNFGNPWLFGLLSFIGPGSIGAFTLEELLANPEFSLASVQESAGKDGRIISVRLVHSRGFFLIDFAEKNNYLANRAEYSIANGKIKSIHTVHGFSQPSSGCYYPENVILENYVDGKLRETVRTFIKITSLDFPNKNSTMRLSIPAGTTCQDILRNEIYKVDGDGNRVGALLDPKNKPISSASQPIVSISDAKLNQGNLSPLGQSVSEPISWVSWILPVSLACLILACVVGLKLRTWKPM
jgi:hypothetical protein